MSVSAMFAPPLVSIGGGDARDSEDFGACDPVKIEVRPARIGDMAGTEPIIARFAGRGLMLPKSGDQLLRHFREFVVAVDEEDRVIACGALRIYSPLLAEITSLAVVEPAHSLGIGRRVVERLIVEAQTLGLETVFALTLRDGFFRRLGFSEVPKEAFPLKVWADCRNCPKLHACDEIALALNVRDKL